MKSICEDNGLLKPQQCACRLQVLNAMLLACSGDATDVAVEAMQFLLQEGAVPDTWAPNGSSVSVAQTCSVQALGASACPTYCRVLVYLRHVCLSAGAHARCFCGWCCSHSAAAEAWGHN